MYLTIPVRFCKSRGSSFSSGLTSRLNMSSRLLNLVIPSPSHVFGTSVLLLMLCHCCEINPFLPIRYREHLLTLMPV